MKFGHLSKLVTLLSVAASFQLFNIAKATANEVFIGLSANNTLVRFNSDFRRFERPVKVTGIDGNLEGIDFRPADGKLYGVTDTNNIYTIDPNTGAATPVSTLAVGFFGGFQSGVDFNPVADRLRLVGSNDQNLRINVETGVVNIDGTLAYAAGDPNAGVDPNLTGAAYINSVAGATSTQLYDIDYALDVLVLQNPPNEGTLRTVGPLGVNFAPVGGFDIFTDEEGVNRAFAVSGSSIYSIDLSTGAATQLATLPNSSGFIGLAVYREAGRQEYERQRPGQNYMYR